MQPTLLISCARRETRYGGMLMRKPIFSVILCVAGFGGALTSTFGQTNPNIATYHGLLGVALTLDERCHVMKPKEQELVQTEWQASLSEMGKIKDVQERAKFLFQSLTVEKSLETTPCRSARKVIDDTLV